MTPRILDDIATNITQVQERIAAACRRVGRSPNDVTLVAVSKTMPPEIVLEAIAAGVLHLGENRPEEAAQKMPLVNAQATPFWHMIGHVQSRKAADVVAGGYYLVHSLDSLKLAQRYDRFAGETGVRLRVLLEVNVSGEATKSGWNVGDWETNPATRANFWGDVDSLLGLPYLDVCGLMTMAPFVDDPEATRPVFRALARLRQDLARDFGGVDWQHLSMGMTNDYTVAIEEGATLVRVGRAIFGERG